MTGRLLSLFDIGTYCTRNVFESQSAKKLTSGIDPKKFLCNFLGGICRKNSGIRETARVLLQRKALARRDCVPAVKRTGEVFPGIVTPRRPAVRFFRPGRKKTGFFQFLLNFMPYSRGTTGKEPDSERGCPYGNNDDRADPGL